MKELNALINGILRQNNDPRAETYLSANSALRFPFSRESDVLTYMLSVGYITYQDYVNIIDDYNNRNRYLDLYEMAPRTFGETWGEQHIRNLFPEFVKATKDNLYAIYPEFDGEFDLWLNGIRIEVKACRANSTKSKGSLASRAYLHEEASANGFKYHYQQLKPSCCDVFIWIGVCRDELLYWVLTSDQLLRTNKLGPQHRHEQTGLENGTVFEGQVFMTEQELAPFRVPECDVLNAVRLRGRG